MTFSKALLMALLLVALGSYVYHQERKIEQQDEAALTTLEKVRVFAGITKDNLTGIRALHAGDSYRLVRDGEQRWVLHDPAGAEADPQLMGKIVDSLIALESQNTILPEEVSADEAVYGLAPPELVLTLEGTFGKRSLSFGKKHSVSARRYAQPEADGRIFLVDDAVFALLARSKADLRNRFPARFPVEQAVRISSVTQDRPPLLFRKAPDPRGGPDRWTMIAEGVEIEADSDLVNKELTELANVKVQDFVDGPVTNLAPFGLLRPKLILNVELEGAGPSPSSSLLFQIGQGVGMESSEEGFKAAVAYYLKLPEVPTLFRVETPVFSAWWQPPEHFRDRTPFDALSSDDLRRIHVKRGAGLSESWALVRDTTAPGERWHLERPAAPEQQVEAAPAPLDAWLERLFRLQVLSYPALESASPDTFGLNSPVMEIVLEPAEAGRPTMALIIAGEVQAAAQGGVQPADAVSMAPRYGAVRRGTEQPVPVVLSAATLPELDQAMEFFRAQDKK